jgi:hypothetical protein
VSAEKFALKAGALVQRRKLLARAGTATLALFGLEGLLAPIAQALYDSHGCQLCNDPSDGCGPNLDCGWKWTTCWNAGDCNYYFCYEGRQTGGDCSSPDCPSYCSWFTGPYAPCC